MAISRSDKMTIEAKKREVYSDFMTNFDINPFTGILAKVTNEEAIKQSLKQLVLTTCGERFYDPNKGSKVSGSLFELYDLGLVEVMRLQLQNSIGFYEPRVVVQDVRVREGLDANQIDVDIIFSVINIPSQNFSLTVNVQRAR